jgi:hypothetical protein
VTQPQIVGGVLRRTAAAGFRAMIRSKFAGGHFLALLCLVAAADQARAQDYVQPPCPGDATPRFEDHLQSLWYRRFWTGECRDLSVLRCHSGRPYWNDMVRTLTARAPEAQRAEVAARACRLGRQIGLEWTRPSAERRIDTDDLRALNAMLDGSPDVATGLAAVEARVMSKIGS